MTSTVRLPAEAVPGRLTCHIDLSPEQQRVFLDKLKYAVTELIKRRNAGTVEGIAAAVTQPAQLPAPATEAAPLPAGPTPAPPAVSAQPVVAPAPAFPAAVPQTAAAPAAAAPSWSQQPAAAALVQPPQPAAPAQPAAQPAARPAAQPAAAPAFARAPQPATASGPLWQLCWTTDPLDHNGDAVSSCAYMPSIAGLPGGEGHAGWLVSSSRGLLNLWEASPSGGRGEAALLCMHSQGTDYSCVCMDAERSTGMLLCASQDRSGGEWVSAHSLEVDTLLAPKGRCPMPHNASSKIAGQNCLAVASLHPFGGPLAETCVASYGGALVVWPVGTSSKPVASNSATPGTQAPKALWKAHASLTTCLHRSAYGLLLFSGAADGKVHMFNMREKPNQPNAVFTQQGRITGIHQLNDTELLTTAGDGRLMVWDVRNATVGPTKFCVPDGRPILRMALSPFADSVAVATTGGIYSVDLLDPACHATPVAPGAPQSPVTALTWNTATLEIVVAGGPGPAGSISVFKQRLGGGY